MSSIWFSHAWHCAIILLFLFSLDTSSATVSEVNLALHKDTSGSPSVAEIPPSTVVDGMKDTCWETLYIHGPWLLVHLHDVYKVISVKITFNTHVLFDIWSTSVYVHMEGGTLLNVCQQSINDFVFNSILVSCHGEIGDIVYIQLQKNGVLNLCEVEVFGEKPFQPTPGYIASRHYCRYNKKASQVINSFVTRSTLECAALCTQTQNCDTFHFETNADKKLLCQLKQTSTNGILDPSKQDYNIC